MCIQNDSQYDIDALTWLTVVAVVLVVCVCGLPLQFCTEAGANIRIQVIYMRQSLNLHSDQMHVI